MAQIFGAFLAALLVYVQWNTNIKVRLTQRLGRSFLLTSGFQAAEGLLRAAGKFDSTMFTPQGPAGIFALYAPPGAKLGQVFLNEFVCVCIRRTLGYTTRSDARTRFLQDFLIGLVIWSCMDPTNFFVPPPAAPFIVAFA